MNRISYIVKKSVIRLVFVGLLLVIFNKIYTHYFWLNDLDEHGPMLYNLQQVQDTSDVLYFGESSNFTTHPDDYNQLRISDNVALQHPNLRIGTINHGAYHVGMYLPLISQIKTTSPVQTVIVTMNLRTFNQDVIYSPSEANLRLSSRMYQPRSPLLNRALVSFKYYDNRSGHERDFLKWKAWTYDTLKSDLDSISFEFNTIRRWCEVPKFLDSNDVQDDAKRQLADQYIKAYAFQINDQNPMVQEFDELLQIAKEKNLHIVLNLIPENVEDAQNYIGYNLVWLMKQNRDYLVHRYTNQGAVVVDNLEILESIHFLDRAIIPQEHYDAAGREIVGKHVAKALND
ncbi:MAG: hypothetical protein ACI9JN_002382 [Bacteroidia bacterium]|jgi:hypothetical protein